MNSLESVTSILRELFVTSPIDKRWRVPTGTVGMPTQKEEAVGRFPPLAVLRNVRRGGPGEGAEHGFKRVSVTPSVLFDSLRPYWLQPSRGSSRHRDRTPVSSIAGEFFTDWATKEALKRVNCAINRTKIITKGQSCLEQPVGRNAPKESIPCWRDSADWNSFILENVAERCNKGMWRYALHLRMDFKAWFVGQ